MKVIKIWVIAVFAGLLIGCGSEPETKTQTEKPQGVIPEAQLRVLEKANEMEKMLLDAEKARKKAMEAQGI